MRLRKVEGRSDKEDESTDIPESNVDAASVKFLKPIVSLQRAWRAYVEGRRRSLTDNSTPNPTFSFHSEDDGIEKLSNHADAFARESLAVDGGENISVLDDSLRSNFLAPPGGADSETESVVSDYSEMADPVKEHLANVQIVREEDSVGSGSTGKRRCERFVIRQKLFRGNGEDADEFARRVRKWNCLSLAQEFAELKRENADALPFNLHEERYRGDGESEGGVDADEETTTSDDAEEDSGSRDDASGSERTIRETSGDVFSSDRETVDVRVSQAFLNSDDLPQTVLACETIFTNPLLLDEFSHNLQSVTAETKTPGAFSSSSVEIRSSTVESSLSDVSGLLDEASSSTKENGNASSDELDAFRIEEMLPQFDWTRLEKDLSRATEEDHAKQFSGGRDDRDKICRRLAMSVDDDDDWCSGERRTSRRSSLHTRLQSGMNLEMCFINEAADDSLDDDDDACDAFKRNRLLCVEGNKYGDLLNKQSFFEAEAKRALAQVRPFAKLQMQKEKRIKKDLMLYEETANIPGLRTNETGIFYDTSSSLEQTKVAQLQAIVNDCHSRIEVLNQELMELLIDRADLHMAQDSMLVDIEDLTGRAKEYASKIDSRNEKTERNKTY